jgi:hypothetical protein
MEARSLGHRELIVLFNLEIACMILTEMVTDDFINVHKGIIQLLSAMYLSLVLKCLFIYVSHKIVNAIVKVDKEESFKLSHLVNRDYNFFLDYEFAKFD